MPMVSWRLAAGDADIASVRYRCLIPNRHLREQGYEARLSWGADDPLAREQPDALVIVKAFGDAEVELAERAVEKRVPVHVDVCDNVFAPGYKATSPDNLRQLASFATSVVVTGSALEQAMRAELGPDVPLRVVPDPVETPSDVRWAGRAIWWARRNGGVLRAGREVAGGVRRDLSKLRPRLAAKRPRRGLPQVIWFGNVGSVQPRFGLINLTDIADELAAAAEEEPFRLLVVSGNRGTYERTVGRWPFETGYAQWDRLGIFDHLRRSSVALVPNSRDAFSACKSPNRVVHALSQGVPVVATRIASTEPFDGCVAFDDFEGGIVSYLRDRELAAEHVGRGRELIERDLDGEVVARAWAEVLG